ncbi:unnamed protein product [Eruca vesicaria subsp. sativa]|uniref:Uncharacterized protein n=1 Tax=Eruca vesicaria subsp. sativa TaxID=29727 RepID=A0ABC8KIR4_ERUVS|nr:unnamed protein product [Eruca vesicaria subsp. sativa]
MRCKRHTADSTSTLGVCASCLRERLFPLSASEDNDHLSVSPHDANRTSDAEKILETNRSFKKKQTGLSRFSTFFRTRSNDSTFSPSSSWLSNVLPKKQSTCYIEDLIASEPNHRQRYCKGLSPANGLESVEESPGRARRASPATGTPGRRRRKTATMALCLSPLVRAKPNNSSFGYTGEMKSPVKPHISTAASFYGNRSKKLADLGRADHRR